MIDKILVFDLKGKFACWKKFYSNSSSFTYDIPTRTNLIGILASILELPRDSYYESLHSDNCKLSLQIKTEFKKQFHCINYFKKPNERSYTQVRLEILQPINIQNDLIVYRIYVWIKDSKMFEELISRIKDNNQGFGIYLGQRQFRGYAEFVDLTRDVEPKNNSQEIESITNIKNVNDEEDIILDDANLCIERMPLDFEFAEKDKAGNIDTAKLNSNYLNRELLNIGRIAYQKKPSLKIQSKSPFKSIFQINCNGQKQNIAFYEVDS